MTPQQQLKWTIEQWEKYTENERFLPAKNTGQRVVKSLQLELENGEPYCVCHLNKLKDCPAQSQNRYRFY